MLGAQGALLGTRFYACTESLGHSHAKQLVVESCGDETIRSNVFDYARGLNWLAPYTARALKNKFTAQWLPEKALSEKIDAAERTKYQQALEAGDFSVAGVLAGEVIDLIHDILPAEQIVKQIIKETYLILSNITTA